MCNPRRVEINATRTLAQNWSREVARTIRLQGTARGEACLVEQLAQSQAPSVLTALAQILAQGQPGWEQSEGSWRHPVQGGYLRYHPDSAELEIVAVAETQLEVEGHASQTLQGQSRAQLEAKGTGTYFDDHWGGHTEERARAQAEQNAQIQLERLTQQRLDEDAERAAAAQQGELDDQARAAGAQALAEAQASRRQQLEGAAAQNLEEVGLRARTVVQRLLGNAYRQAILTYAEAQGAQVVRNQDDGQIIEIELLM